jgi:NADH-quinone oxidoreductase subunit J
MGIEPILFWLFAAVTVAGGLMAVLLPRIVHAVFSLLLCFTGVAAVYALAGADFLAILQIVVYVGGVLVLIAFGILLTGRTAEALGFKEVRNRKLGVAVALLLFLGLVFAISKSRFAVGSAEPAEGTTASLGRLLLGDWIVAFEFASIVLLAALVGAAYLVRRSEP